MEIRKNTVLAFVGGIVIGFFLAVGLGMLWNKMYGETAYNSLMQIGIFKYESKEEVVKTVPIVKVYDD